MTTFELYDFYELTKDNNIILSYSGPILQEGLEGLAKTLRAKLVADDVDMNKAQSLFSVFVEQMQNISRYSAEKYTENGNELSYGIFILGTINDGHFIHCGNQVFRKQVEVLAEKIDYINSLNKDELKKYYRERRRMEPDEGSLGASIGLIEIARRSGNPIQYKFTDVNDEIVFFSMYVVV